MTNVFKKIASATQNRTTYRMGLLQTRAYRILKAETARILKSLGLSPVEWAFLGLLYDNKSMRMKEAALQLGVEPPFVTVMIAHLSKEGLVQETRGDSDNRVKHISLSKKGEEFVPKTELLVRNEIRYLVSGVGPVDLLGYISVLEAIITNER